MIDTYADLKASIAPWLAKTSPADQHHALVALARTHATPRITQPGKA